MIGIVEDKDKVMSLDFKQKGDLIFIIGESTNDISSSEYLASYHGVKASPAPYFDLDKEYAMQHMVKGLIQNELVNAVHDVADGGLFVTLVEMSGHIYGIKVILLPILEFLYLPYKLIS